RSEAEAPPWHKPRRRDKAIVAQCPVRTENLDSAILVMKADSSRTLRRHVAPGVALWPGRSRGRRPSRPPLGCAILSCCPFIGRIDMPARYSIAIRLTQAEERRWK